MNVLEELRSLDPRDPGRWPFVFRAGAVVLAFVLVTGLLVYYFVWSEQRPALQQKESEEQTLRQLPGKTEVPSLLVDISQTGLGAGLSEKLFEPQAEVKKDFYAEKPIKIRLTGSYHQFGEFVSGIAALPRIVTLDDINIKPDSKDAYDQLSMELIAKTYRYLDEDEIAAGEADKKKDNVTHRAKPAG